MLHRTLKMTLWVMYDHLGKLVAVNLFWALTVALPGAFAVSAMMTGDAGVTIFIGVPVLLLTLGVLHPLVSVGIAHMAQGMIDTHDGSIGDFFLGMRRYGLRAVGMGIFYTSAFVCLPVSAWFYATKLRGAAPWLGYLLGAASLWALAGVALTALLALPALVQKKAGVFQSVKLAGLLVLDNPLFALGLAFYAVVFFAVSLIPPILFFLSGAAFVVLQSSAYEMLSRKYAALRLDREGGAAPVRPIHVVSQGGKLRFDDAGDDYLNRGVRDFLFPWKG